MKSSSAKSSHFTTINNFEQRINSWQRKLLAAFLLLIFYLSLIGIFWIIPFPKLGFLKTYNGYFNWASFLIAGLIYYWLKKAAVASYVLFVVLFVLSYAVSRLEAADGFNSVLIYPLALVLSAMGLFYWLKLSAKEYFKALLILPVWLINFKQRA